MGISERRFDITSLGSLDSAIQNLTNLPNIAKEVVETVLEHGSLTKREILEVWDLCDVVYPALQEQVLTLNSSLQKGPKRSGGFIVKKQRVSAREEVNGDTVFLRVGWEKDTAERLSQLISYSDLESFLGGLQQTLRQVRKAETNEDRRGTKYEFASALVLRYGIDLFGQKEIRQAVAKACKTTFPGKWHPGKSSAIEFVQKTGFSPELAGIPVTDRPPDYEYLEGKITLGELKPFQQEVKAKLRQTLDDCSRGIITLPTGAGKTRVAVDCIRDWLTDKYGLLANPTKRAAVLWLAHTEELCEQAYSCFKDVWDTSTNVCPLLLVRFWGRYTNEMTNHRDTLKQITTKPSVLVSTPQRIVNLLKEEGAVVKDLKASLSLLVIDEAHRAAALSYKKIINALANPTEQVATVGLTATPLRKEYIPEDPYGGTKELREIFSGNLIEPESTLGGDPRKRLQEMRILASPVFETIYTSTVINVPNVPDNNSFSDEDALKIDRILALKVDKSTRRLIVLDHILPIAQDSNNSILYFGPSVRDAECMTYLLRRHHVPAEVVHGGTRHATRRHIINEFKAKNISVLCNCEVLTTGFDAPVVTHLVIARPTVSAVLYEQMIGRGLRGPEFGGTEECIILNCEDNIKGDHFRLGYIEFIRKLWKSQDLIESKDSNYSLC
jgi:DNA repair protein RadD